MPNYTKLFNSIVTSTIWTEDDKTRIVWITMLAIADQNGEVHASIPGLARIAGVEVSDVESAIAKFLSPDEYSRTVDNEGRRIAVIDGGWELLNHAKYRRMASLADQKESNAKRQKRFRDRNAGVTVRNATVTPDGYSNETVTQKTDKAEAEAKAYTKEEEEEDSPPPTPTFSEVQKFAASQPMPIPDDCVEAFFDEMEALQWTYKGQPCFLPRAWHGRFRRYATNWIQNLQKAS